VIRKGHRAKVLELSEKKHGAVEAVQKYVNRLVYEK
jgi:hypothetical protein